MTIQVGDAIPEVTLKHLGANGMEDQNTAELFKGKKAVLFGVPGAFTPTCSAKHLPGFLSRAQELRAKGVDLIACMSVNDPFVMAEWAKSQNAGEDVVMVADGNADLTKAMGLEMDASGFCLGTRCQRFALIAEDGKVTELLVEEPGAFEVSSAESVLSKL
jgi:peroxiredoxin